jgi:hypothetical protein
MTRVYIPAGTKKARQINSSPRIGGQGLTKEQEEWNKQVVQRKQQRQQWNEQQANQQWKKQP